MRETRTEQTAAITVTEAAKLLRVGKNQAYEAIHRGELRVLRIGKRMLIPRRALERLLEQGAKAT